jgi:hypothetical protein
MSRDDLSPEEPPESPQPAEISVEVDQIHVSDGGISNVAGRDIHIHYPSPPVHAPRSQGWLRHFLAGRGALSLILIVLVSMVSVAWLGSGWRAEREKPTATASGLVISATPSASSVPGSTPSATPTTTPNRIWMRELAPIYRDVQGETLTGLQAQALSIWYFCGAEAQRVRIAQSDCSFAQGWVEAEAVKLGATPTITPTPTITSTATPTPTPSVTLPPTLTPSLTPTPVISATHSPALTPTLPSQVYRGLDQECFSVEHWTPGLGNVMSILQKGSCWDLNSWYMLPEAGGISFLVEDDKITANVMRGIYTPIRNPVEIHFKARINELTADNKDGLLGFGIGDYNQSAIQENGVGEFLTFRMGAHADQLALDFGSGLFTPKISREYTSRTEQEIVLRLDRIKIQVYLNGSLWIERAIESIPQYYFWIVYSLPNQGGSLKAMISDFRIIDW